MVIMCGCARSSEILLVGYAISKKCHVLAHVLPFDTQTLRFDPMTLLNKMDINLARVQTCTLYWLSSESKFSQWYSLVKANIDNHGFAFKHEFPIR